MSAAKQRKKIGECGKSSAELKAETRAPQRLIANVTISIGARVFTPTFYLFIGKYEIKMCLEYIGILYSTDCYNFHRSMQVLYDLKAIKK